MPAKTDNQIKLSDGHFTGYAGYGDPQGTPVLYFHGMPGSRFDGNTPNVDEIATRLHARLIIIERPGIGLSDYKPYSIASWPDIVSEFADALHLDRFAVMGVSSGGKYVAACAWKIPQRLTHASIVSGNCAYDLPGARETLSRQDRQLYWLADKAPWLMRLLLSKIASNARKDPSSALSLFPELSEPDKVVLAQTDLQRLLGEMINGAFKQGTRGMALDWKLEARPWGFSLKDIGMLVHIFHGGQDRLVPVAQGQIMAKALPNARARFFPDDGHLSILVNHYEELLSAIV